METERESARVAGECNCTALRKAARRVSLLYDRALAPSGLGVNQYGILSELDRHGEPLSLGRLARVMVMDRSALGHNLRPLERDHLVVLGVDEEDRRSRAIAITASGRRRLAAARKYWQQAQIRFQRTMGAEQSAALRALLADVAGADYGDPS